MTLTGVRPIPAAPAPARVADFEGAHVAGVSGAVGPAGKPVELHATGVTPIEATDLASAVREAASRVEQMSDKRALAVVQAADGAYALTELVAPAPNTEQPSRVAIDRSRPPVVVRSSLGTKDTWEVTFSGPLLDVAVKYDQPTPLRSVNLGADRRDTLVSADMRRSKQLQERRADDVVSIDSRPHSVIFDWTAYEVGRSKDSERLFPAATSRVERKLLGGERLVFDHPGGLTALDEFDGKLQVGGGRRTEHYAAKLIEQLDPKASTRFTRESLGVKAIVDASGWVGFSGDQVLSMPLASASA